MSKKTGSILSAVIVMMLCLCLIVGATFALFGKQSAVDIAVTSGDIAVNAQADGLVLYSAQADPDGTLTDGAGNKYSYDRREDGTFVNGGTAQLSGGTITIDRIAPGDMAEFKITVTNRSNIAVKYRTILSSDGDIALLDALEVTIGGETFGGNTVVSDWTALEAGDGITEEVLGEYLVSVAMPMDTEDVGGLSASISFEVEAVQGNAVTSDPEEGVTYVYNKTDLYRFAQEINAGSTEYRNTTLRLMSDIDLGGTEWTPISAWNGELNGFVLDGQGHTIYNMTISNGGSYTGFIGNNSSSFTIKDLTFDGTNIKAQGSFVGTVIGYQYGAVTLENVHAINGVIDVSDCVGIRIGGLVGYSVLHDGAQLYLSDCSVENYELYGYHNVSGLVGTLINYGTLTDRWSMTGCTVKDVTIYRDNPTLKYSSAYTVDGGSYPEYEENKAYFETFGNTSKNLQIFYTDENGLVKDLIAGEYLLSSAQDLQTFAAEVNAGKDFSGEKVVLTDNIDLSGIAWTPIGVKDAPFKGNFDGNGFVISNLTCELPDAEFVGLFGDLNSPAVVENVIVENATVTGKASVGVIAGGWTGTIRNCTVRGDIYVTGNYKVGGILGDGYVSVTDCTVAGNEGSFVKGVYLETDLEGDNVGGAIGYSGEASGRVYSNIHVSGIDVTGTRKVGGVVGYLNYGYENGMTLTQSSFSNGSVTIAGPEEYLSENASKLLAGGLVGEYAAGNANYPVTVSDCSVENVEIFGYSEAVTGTVIGGTRGAYGEQVLTAENLTESNVTVSYTITQ